jgi:hypothetical protein
VTGAAEQRDRECAAEGCLARCPRHFLMCRDHWYRVPRAIRQQVWRAYKAEGVFSEAYTEAVDAAIASLR